jgi:hypothetical protein
VVSSLRLGDQAVRRLAPDMKSRTACSCRLMASNRRLLASAFDRRGGFVAGRQ